MSGLVPLRPTIKPMPTRDQVIDSLRSVIDPELRRDIVELEMVRSVDVHENGVVDVMGSQSSRFIRQPSGVRTASRR